MDYPLGIVSPSEADPIQVFLRSREGTREGRKRIKKKERDGCDMPKTTFKTNMGNSQLRSLAIRCSGVLKIT